MLKCIKKNPEENMTNIYEKYAKLLVNYSLKLKKKDKLLIKTSYLAEPLIQEVYKQALIKGAYPEISLSINQQEKIFYDNANINQLNYVPKLYEYAINNFDSLLIIRAPFNVKELENTESEKKRIHAEAQKEIKKTFLSRSAKKQLNWNICVFPTNSAAQESKMSLTEYQDFVFSACYLNENEPVKKWEQISKDQEKIIKYLKNKNTIKLKGNDINLSYSVKGRKWINSDGHYNMPSGEIFTSPVEDSVYGKIRFSYPGIFMEQEIEDINLEIKNGEVVSWKAGVGQNLLDQFFEIPGSKHFGEAAIGTNYQINKFTKNTLFDEKIGGTIHMALGFAFPETGGKNECAVHWDLIADMKNQSEIYADNELFYKNGKFII